MGKSKHKAKPKRKPSGVQKVAPQSSTHIVQEKAPGTPRKRSGPKSRTSTYLGVTRYKRTGRWEAHIWDSTEAEYKRGRQLHLGSFPAAHPAAVAYDRAAIKIRQAGATLNFPGTDYSKDDYENLSKKEFIGQLRKWAQSAELLVSLADSKSDSDTEARTYNKRGQREQQASSNVEDAGTDKLNTTDDGDSAESQPVVRRSLRLRRHTDKVVEPNTSAISASPGSVISSEPMEETHDPLWEPEAELQSPLKVNSRTLEPRDDEDAALDDPSDPLPELNANTEISGMLQEELMAEEVCTAKKDKQSPCSQEEAADSSNCYSDSQLDHVQQLADEARIEGTQSLFSLELAGAGMTAFTMSSGCKQQGRESLDWSQSSALAEFDQMEPWALPAVPPLAYETAAYDMEGYDAPQTPLYPGFKDQSATEMLTSPGVLLKYEIDQSLCQDGPAMDSGLLPPVMDLQFLTGASLLNPPMPSYYPFYPPASPGPPNCLAAQHELMQANIPWTVGMPPTPATTTLPPVPLQVQQAGHELCTPLRMVPEALGQPAQANIHVSEHHPLLAPQPPAPQHRAEISSPRAVAPARTLGEGPAAGVQRLVRSVQMRGQLHLDASELAPPGALAALSPNKGQRARGQWARASTWQAAAQK